MLLSRSILKSHACVLVLLVATVNSQYYNSDYSVHDDADEDHSSYKEEDDKPDYSKYYKGDSSSAALSAPILGASEGVQESDNGFVSPLDFSGFIGSSHFGLGSAPSAQQTLPNIQISNPFHLGDGSSNQAKSSGFVNAQDFKTGFGGQDTGFNPENFEAEAQRIGNLYEGSSSFDPKTGQSFETPKKINPNVIAPKYTKTNHGSEADDLNKYSPASYKKYNKNLDAPLKKYNYEKNSGYKKPNYDYPATPAHVSFQPVVPTLSSYTAPQTSYSPQLNTYSPQHFPATKYTNAPKPYLAPYQKYSFQPTAGLPAATFESIKSTLAPYNLNTQYSSNVPYSSNAPYSSSAPYSTPYTASTAYSSNTPYAVPSTAASYYNAPTQHTAEPSEYVSKKVSANCQKVAKQLSPDDISHGRFRRDTDAMNCYVCKDPKTGGSFEQCSYTSDPDNDKSYFRGHAEKYSTKTYTPDHNRKKRSPATKDNRNKRQKEDAEEEKEEYENPYDFKKKSSFKFNSKPKEFDSDSYYKSPDFSSYERPESYEYGPEHYTDAATQEEKSYSELQSEDLKKNGADCKEVKKDSLTCMVCKNPKTGGNYEQCSYTSEPKDKKYAYVKERKYNSNDPNPEEKSVESTEIKPTVRKNKSRVRTNSKKPENVPFHYSASTRHPKQTPKTSEEYYRIPDKYEQAGSDKRPTVNDKYKRKSEHDDYLYKLFPEYAEKESQKSETKSYPGFDYKSDLPEYFTAEESKKDVDTVLQEFAQKDRSNCKKIARNKMTCYLCLDSKGIQHEECMFVSESQPKSSHIAYHEVKEFKSDPKNKDAGEETAHSNQAPDVLPTDAPTIKRKSYPKKVISAPLKRDVEPLLNVKPEVKPRRIVRRKTNINKEYLGNQAQESQNSEVRVERPENMQAEAQDDNSEAHASEFVPVYSKALPRYLSEISEVEKVIHEVMASG